MAFDTSILTYLFDEEVRAPVSSATGQPVERCRERVEYLLATLQAKKAKIVIPTPSLAECLVRAQDGAPERLSILKRSRHFRISPFDERAAIEFAAMQDERRRSGTKSSVPRAKAKFDDQIVAISSIEAVTTIYSDDDHIKKLSGSKFRVLGIEDLPLPPEDDQQAFAFDPRPSSPDEFSGE